MEQLICRVVGQTEPGFVTTQKGEQLAKCYIRLKELGGDYAQEYNAAVLGNMAQTRYQAGDVVAVTLRFRLFESNGNMEAAVEYLREKGLAAANKKSGRIAAEGAVESYIHMGGKIGVLVEINCETDFVGKTDTFKNLCHDVAMHIAAAAPEFVSKDEIPAARLEDERRIAREQVMNDEKNSKKPPAGSALCKES